VTAASFPAFAQPEGSTFSAGDFERLSACWFPVAVAADLVDAPLSVTLLDVALVLFRSGAGITAALDRCPHRGAALSLGWAHEGGIVCPYHGLRFDGAGTCTSIPSQPEARPPERMRLKVRPCVERFGLIWTSLASEAPLLPEFEAWERTGFQKIMCPSIDIMGSAGRQIEGFLDVSHFAFAHLGTFGDPTKPVVPDYRVERTARGLRSVYDSDISNFAPDQRWRAPEGFVWRRTFEVFLPFSARLVVDFPEGRQLWILNAVSPVSARRIRMFCPQARDFDTEEPEAPVAAFNHRIFLEDRRMVESQSPLDLPLDGAEETHIAADRASIAYRRLLREMGLELRGREAFAR
jgi:vanillate O-demethylase monooxygenase subunit